LSDVLAVGANFSNANLYAADFDDAFLSDANFTGANLDAANLSDAEDLRGVIGINHKPRLHFLDDDEDMGMDT